MKRKLKWLHSVQSTSFLRKVVAIWGLYHWHIIYLWSLVTGYIQRQIPIWFNMEVFVLTFSALLWILRSSISSLVSNDLHNRLASQNAWNLNAKTRNKFKWSNVFSCNGQLKRIRKMLNKKVKQTVIWFLVESIPFYCISFTNVLSERVKGVISVMAVIGVMMVMAVKGVMAVRVLKSVWLMM